MYLSPGGSTSGSPVSGFDFPIPACELCRERGKETKVDVLIVRHPDRKLSPSAPDQARYLVFERGNIAGALSCIAGMSDAELWGGEAEGVFAIPAREGPCCNGCMSAKWVTLTGKIGEGVAAGYKVVRVEGTRIFSAIATGPARVEYRLGKRSFAPKWLAKRGYFLTFFPRLEDALDFTRFFSSLPLAVMEVRAYGVLYIGFPLRRISLDLITVDQFYRRLGVDGGSDWLKKAATAYAIEPVRWVIAPRGEREEKIG